MSSAQHQQPHATDPQDVLAEVGSYWGWLLALGVLSLAAGVLVLAWPGATIRVIATLFGLQLLILGAFRFVAAFSRDIEGTGQLAPVLLAALSVLAGILVLRSPFQTIPLLGLILGVFWTVNGVVEMYSGIANRDRPYRGLAIAGGILSTIAGILFLVYPARSVFVVTLLVGVWLVVFSVIDMLEALRLRAAAHRAGYTRGPITTS